MSQGGYTAVKYSTLVTAYAAAILLVLLANNAPVGRQALMFKIAMGLGAAGVTAGTIEAIVRGKVSLAGLSGLAYSMGIAHVAAFLVAKETVNQIMENRKNSTISGQSGEYSSNDASVVA